MVRVPTVHKRKLRLRDWHLEALTGLLGSAPGFVWAIKSAVVERNLWFALGLSIASLLIAALAVTRALRKRSVELQFEPPKEPQAIVDWAKQVHRLLNEGKSDEDREAEGVRITVHAVRRRRWLDEPFEFQQLTNYVGGHQTGFARTHSARPGIIGLVARYRQPFAMVRTSDNDEKFLEEMVLNWAFTWDEAKALSPDRRSWMAVPLTDGTDGPVVAVVYLDSKQDDFFGEDLQERIVDQSIALAERLRDRYNR